MNHVLRTAEERRREIQLNADRMGIDDAYISELVETFYARVRADATLGPSRPHEGFLGLGGDECRAL